MPYYTYVIESVEGYHYTGHTPDLKRRLSEHNHSMCHSTKHGHNWRIIYFEEFSTRSEAMIREKYLKSSAGRRFLKKTIAGWSPDNDFVVIGSSSPA